MTSGLPNKEKARIRQQFARGEIGRDELLQCESASYHSAGTCTFYGTANSNQLIMEFMGLHLPGSSFVNPGTELREALTREAARRIIDLTEGSDEYMPAGKIVDERTVVNGLVGLLASGGSTNHTLHLVAMARAAGILIDWQDFSDISDAVPLLAHVYPNGSADINHSHAAGGIAFMIRELLAAGLLHEDVNTVAGAGLHRYGQEPFLDNGTLVWRDGVTASQDLDVLRPVSTAFADTGGMKVMTGNIGRAVTKVSALRPEHRVIEAAALTFDNQQDVLAAFKAGKMERDAVVVVRYQGPKANGMPELHELTPPLGVLLDKGFKVALVTDGRMSGASGKVPAAIQVSPECLAGGMLAKVRDGDMLRVDTLNGSLEVLVPADEFARRDSAPYRGQHEEQGMGRELFEVFRSSVSAAEDGASALENPAAVTRQAVMA